MFRLFRPRAAALLAGVSASALSVATFSSAHAQSAQTLDPITVVATKSEERAIDSLAAVSTIRPEQMNQILPSRLSDIFFGVPSVSFQQRGDDPATAINLRGLQDFGRVAVIVDGARQNFQTTGHNASGTFYLDPELLAGADVVRGPVSNIYGSGAIGGVVSFRTKDVDDVLNFGERWGAVANTMIGSNLGRGLGSLFTAIRVNPNVDLFAGGFYRAQSNYKDGNGNEVPNSAFSDWGGVGKITIRPADGHEIKLSGIFQQYDYVTGQRTNNTNTSESNFRTRVENDILTARWRYSRPEDMLFNFDASVYWTRTQSEQTKITNGVFGSTSLGNAITGFIGDHRSFTIDTTGFDIHNTTRFETGPLRHAVTYGVDYFIDKVNVVDPTGTGDLFTPSGQRTVDGAFAQWKVNYSTWFEFIGAARYDAYKLEGGNTSSEGDRISPKATVGITPIQWLTFYGTYAEGYRAPSVTETIVAGAHPSFIPIPGAPGAFTFLPNPGLRPEVGHTKEVGINVKYDDVWMPGDRLRAKFNVYRNDIDDYINLVTFGPPVLICPAPPGFCPVPVPFIVGNTYSLAQYQNVANARIEGVEFEGTYDAGAWFAGLSATHTRGRDATTRDPLATIPPDQVAITAGARFWDRKLTVSVRWTAVAAKKASDIPDLDHNGVPDFTPTRAYNLVNVYVGYQPTPDVLAALSVENLLNEQYLRYLDAVATPTPLFSPGITYKASLRIRFGVTGT